jgi:bifunctional DNA-binding transcriptional regulator/antitoxin component of YhaV-PrlF toxin-antitoxin module
MSRGKQEPAVPGLLYGPKPIQSGRQVGIPASIMEAVGLKPGDHVHFQIREDAPYEITIIRSDKVKKIA